MTLYIRDRLNRHFLNFSYTEEADGSSPFAPTKEPPGMGVPLLFGLYMGVLLFGDVGLY